VYRSNETSVCPSCNRSRTLGRGVSRIHPERLPNEHIELEEFKAAVNNALKIEDARRSYDEVEALLLNWEANDLGLKTPEKGSVILDETLALKKVLEEEWGFHATHHLIPSTIPQAKVSHILSGLNLNLSLKRVEEKKKILLIVYYNGHGDILNGKLIWSA